MIMFGLWSSHKLLFFSLQLFYSIIWVILFRDWIVNLASTFKCRAYLSHFEQIFESLVVNHIFSPFFWLCGLAYFMNFLEVVRLTLKRFSEIKINLIFLSSFSYLLFSLFFDWSSDDFFEKIIIGSNKIISWRLLARSQTPEVICTLQVISFTHLPLNLLLSFIILEEFLKIFYIFWSADKGFFLFHLGQDLLPYR